MDTSVFAVDLSVWLAWTSDILYIASLSLALFVVVIVSCMVRQCVMTAVGQSDAPKGRAHLAH
jgi:hypothetical protein